MEETTFTDNDSVLVLFSKKITRRHPFRKSREDIPSENHETTASLQKITRRHPFRKSRDDIPSQKITRRQPFRKSRDDIPSEKVVIVEEEVNDIDIGNLEELPRLVSINDARS